MGGKLGGKQIAACLIAMSIIQLSFITSVNAVEMSTPIASFGTYLSNETDTGFSFNAVTSYSPSNESIVDYAWDFGDSNVDSGVEVSHAYALPGTYIVTLRVKDGSGETAIARQELIISAPPSANFNWSIDPEINAMTVSFDAAASSAGADESNIESYLWNFGDGESSAGQLVTHTFQTAGVYDVELTIENSSGQTDSTTQQVTVSDPTDGHIVRVSSTNTGLSEQPALSADGKFVAFSSRATDLVSGDTNNRRDVFVRNIFTNTTERITTDYSATAVMENVGGESYSPSLSADGRYVAYLGTHRLTEFDVVADAYVFDRTTKVKTLVSSIESGIDPDGPVTDVQISANGQFVVFSSFPDDEQAGSVTKGQAIFLTDLTTLNTQQLTPLTTIGEGYVSSDPVINADGSYIAFVSDDPRLNNDATTQAQVYLMNTADKSLQPVAIRPDGGIVTDGYSKAPSISADGKSVSFTSSSAQLAELDINELDDVFVYESETNEITRVSTDVGGFDASDASGASCLSADGRYVAFTSSAIDLTVATETANPDVFLRDLANGTTIRVTSDNQQAEGNAPSDGCSISQDGSRVAFVSSASNLASGDTNDLQDVFLWRE